MNTSKTHVLSQLSQFTGTEYYYPLWPKVLLTDGNGNTLAKQRIPYTDFPFGEISLYACRNEDKWVILLPSEY